MTGKTMAMTPSQIMRELPKAIQAKLPILLIGAPGLGKTSLWKWIAHFLSWELHIWHPAVSDPTDYKGLPGFDGDYAVFKLFKELAFLIEANKPTLVCIDDLGQAAPAVQKALMQLILGRELNGKKVSDYVVFCAASNRKGDKAGVTGILETVKSRFHSIIELIEDVDDWIKWAIENDQPFEMIQFIKLRPELLNQFKPTADLTNTPVPRTVANTGDLFKLGFSPDTEMQMLSGGAGQAFAAEFLGFVQLIKEIPAPDGILLDPTFGQIPSNVSTLYALSGALARLVDDSNVENFFTYLERVENEHPQGKEFSVLTVILARKEWQGLETTQGFVKWAVRNQNNLS